MVYIKKKDLTRALQESQDACAMTSELALMVRKIALGWISKFSVQDHEKDDIVQDTILVVITYLYKIDGDRALCYITEIAKNKLKRKQNMHRTMQRFMQQLIEMRPELSEAI